MALENDELTAEEQAQFDQMRADDAAPQTVEPTADPDAAAEATAAQAAEEANDKRPRTVPQAALHEERERRKDLERQLADERKARQTLDERTNLILQRMGQQQAPQQPQAAAPELPDIQTHPVEHLLGQIQARDNVLASLMQQLEQRNQNDQRTNQMTALQQQTVAMEREYRATNPDYDEAVAHLASARSRELEIAGFNAVERQQILSQEAGSIAQRALQTGRNPAEMAYEMAKARGWQPKASNAADTGDQNATAPAPAERIAQVGRGQQQDGRSLSNARGAAPRQLTAQRLLEMNDAEFDKMMTTPEGRDLMGA